MPQVKVKVTAKPPLLYRVRLALAILLVAWSAALIAGAINGFRFEVE
jgi:hypothetical protein